MAVSSRVFISYRRDDSPAYAGRLSDQLRARFGAPLVFRDIDTLEPGVPFKQLIEESVGSADVLIAVIGPNWATAADGSGRRRLDEPDDFVRLEVGGALRRDIRVIPVLVGGAKMPDAHELPDDLAGLAGRNGLELTDLQWTSGVEQLFKVIEHVLAMQLPDPTPPPAEEVLLSPIVVSLALGGAAMLGVGLFMRWDAGHSFLQNNFGTALPHGGAITSLAPIGIVLAAVLGGVLVHEQATRAVGVGLLFAAGYAGAVKYLRVLQSDHARSAGATVGVLVAMAGGLLVLAAAFLALRATKAHASSPSVTAAILGIAGGLVMIAATAIDFNAGGTNNQPARVARTFEEAFDPVATSLMVVIVAALLLGHSRHAELSAALLTLGVLEGLLWVRYFTVPLLENSSVGSFAPGGIIGIVGAGLVVLGGYLGLAAWRRGPSPVAAVPSV